MTARPQTRKTLGAGALTCLALLCVAPRVEAATLYRIASMEATSTPRVENNRVYYSLYMLFEQRPVNYWVYFDAHTRQLVMEVYDGQVTSPSVRFPRRSPFGTPRFETLTGSRKSLSGEHSQIFIPLQPGWHVESANEGDANVRIVLWKDMTRSLAVRKRGPRFLLYAGVAVVAGLATFLVVRLVQTQ